jgi:hypothetical protein
MDASDAAKEVLKSEKIHKLGSESDQEHEEKVAQIHNDVARIIEFIRNAKITSTEIKANRGSKYGSLISNQYPGVYIHQIITLSDGKHKYSVNNPELIAKTDYADQNKIVPSSFFGIWGDKRVYLSDRSLSRMTKAAPNLVNLYRSALEIRLGFTQEIAEQAADKYVNKNQGRAKAQIIKKMGGFLAECNLKDEDPEFLLQIMKFISRDNFWEMKNFFNYCRRNRGDINFLTPDEVIQAQNLAKAIEIQKS